MLRAMNTRRLCGRAANFGIGTLKRMPVELARPSLFSGVTRGLDPRVHPLRERVLQRRWIAESSPAMTEERWSQPSCIHSNGNRFSAKSVQIESRFRSKYLLIA